MYRVCHTSNVLTYSFRFDALQCINKMLHRKHAPDVDDMSTVADFNDNLFYHMQRERGLEHFAGLSPSRVQELEHTLQANEYLGSFLTTKSSLPQPPHVDYPWEILEEHAQDKSLEIGFFPLTEEGMSMRQYYTKYSRCSFVANPLCRQ